MVMPQTAPNMRADGRSPKKDQLSTLEETRFELALFFDFSGQGELDMFD